MKKRIVFLLAWGLCLMGTVAPTLAAETVWPKRLVIAVSASGNPVTMITQAIARVLEENTPVQRVIVQPLGGIKNFGPLAARGEVDMAVFSVPDMFNAIYGLGDYKEQSFPFFRLLAPAAYQPFVVYTTPDKGIRDIKDLRGKVIYSRNPGNTMFDEIVEVLLAGAGLTNADLKANLTKTNNAMATAAVIEGRADALIAPAMTNVTLELRQAKGECLMITPTDEQADAIRGRLPLGYVLQDISADEPAYVNTAPMPNAPVYRNAVFVGESMAPEVAEALLDAMMSHREEWESIHVIAKDWGELSPALPLMHEGARAWYEKHGLMTDEIRAEQADYAEQLQRTAAK